MRDQKYIRVRDVVERINVSERTVRRWIADGTLPSTKLGGARLVAESDLDLLFNVAEHNYLYWGDDVE